MPQHDVPETLTADHQQHQATETMEYNPSKTKKAFYNAHEYDLIETLRPHFFSSKNDYNTVTNEKNYLQCA